MKFNPKAFSLQKKIEEEVKIEALQEWALRNNYTELPSEFPTKVRFTKASAYAFGRNITKSLKCLLP